MVNEKQQEELKFWENLFKSIKNYKSFRLKDGENKLKFFKKHIPKGLGLDVGCGLVSIFENTGHTVIAIDPLVDEYKNILGEYEHDKNVSYLPIDGEGIGENKKFDFITCINVLDHTPNPDKMLSEIHKALKDDGVFFFQVNWDEFMAKPHYHLLDMEKTNELLHNAGFEVKEAYLELNKKDNQEIFNAICKKSQY